MAQSTKITQNAPLIASESRKPGLEVRMWWLKVICVRFDGLLIWSTS